MKGEALKKSNWFCHGPDLLDPSGCWSCLNGLLSSKKKDNFRQLYYLLPPSFWVGVSTGRPMSWMASLTSRTLQWTRVSLSWWSSLEAGMIISQLCRSLMVFLKSFYLLIMSYPFCFCSSTVCAKPCSLHVPKASRSGTCDCSIEKHGRIRFSYVSKIFTEIVKMCSSRPLVSFAVLKAGRFDPLRTGRSHERHPSPPGGRGVWGWATYEIHRLWLGEGAAIPAILGYLFWGSQGFDTWWNRHVW